MEVQVSRSVSTPVATTKGDHRTRRFASERTASYHACTRPRPSGHNGPRVHGSMAPIVKRLTQRGGAGVANRDPAEFAQADLELAATLDSLSGADNYLALLAELISPHLGARVLEIGAGHGDLTGLLAGPDRHVIATDLSPTCIDALGERFATDDHVSVLALDAGSEADLRALPPVDSALMVNVLEHIHEDENLLRRLGTLVGADGRVVVFVPAFEALYGPFDHSIGHFRRYRVAGMRTLMSDAGLEPELVRYVNAPGFFAWLLTVRLLGQNPTGSKLVGVYDRLVIPIVAAVESRWSPPFGQSILAVGRAR